MRKPLLQLQLLLRLQLLKRRWKLTHLDWMPCSANQTGEPPICTIRCNICTSMVVTSSHQQIRHSVFSAVLADFIRCHSV